MTLALKFMEQRAEGREEGREEERKKLAFGMKERGYTDNTISDLLDVSSSVLQAWFAEKQSIAK